MSDDINDRQRELCSGGVLLGRAQSFSVESIHRDGANCGIGREPYFRALGLPRIHYMLETISRARYLQGCTPT